MSTLPKRAIFKLLIPAAVVSTSALAIDLTITDGSVSVDQSAFGRHGVSNLGDVNGDGYDDLGVQYTNYSSYGVCVFYGGVDMLDDTDATCWEGTQLAGIMGMGDHNDDGYDDVFVWDDSTKEYNIHNGSASGVSSTPDQVGKTNNSFGGYKGRHAESGDFNGDGIDDTLVKADNSVAVAYGPLETTASVISSTVFKSGFVSQSGNGFAADFDQDGITDLVLSDNRNIAIHLGSTSGLSSTSDYTLSRTADGSSKYASNKDFYTGDFDGDGYPDLYVIDNDRSGGSYIHYNDGGTLEATPTVFSTGAVGRDVMDINDDGYADIVDFDGDNDEYHVYYGSSSGVSSTAETITQPSLSEWGSHVTTGDFNGDGAADVMVRQGENIWWSVGAAAVTDTDGDGIDDADDLCPDDAPDSGNDDDLNGCADVATDGTSTVTFDGETDGETLPQLDVYTENGIEYWQTNTYEGGAFFDLGDGTIAHEDAVADSSGSPIHFQYADGSPIIIESITGFNRGTSASTAITASCYVDDVRTVNQKAFQGIGTEETEPVELTPASEMIGTECDYVVVGVIYHNGRDSVIDSLTFSKGSSSTDGDGVCDTTDVVDADSDGVMDDCDAFPTDGSETIDTDGDGTGDNSDAFPDDDSESADTDGDGIGDNADLCSTEDASGYDLDADGCLDDTDGDGLTDDADLCPEEDAYGYDTNDDGCLDDTDGDTVTDDIDAFPDDATEWNDTDLDGVGDNSDAFPMDATEDADTDGDEVGDNTDPCHGYPNDDTDGDSVCDSDDSCPTDALDADADDDGVCDVEDICVGSDNVDSDEDQVCDDIDACDGNDASGDYDEDGLCGDIDNCPADANADQADDDGDDIGNVCDDDDDGDAVTDTDDNCPDDANADQSDLDGDGDGDACDTDDDGDGIVDEEDNCPFYDNADQADSDDDGYGDECDGDDDGDGVADEADLCAGTALDAPFDTNGCSGEQFIELKCGTAADYSWRRSGKFTRCVVRKSKAAQRKGLITRQERQMIIRRSRLELFLARWRTFLRRWC